MRNVTAAPLFDHKNRQYDVIPVASGSPDKPLNTEREMVMVQLCGEPVLPTLADKERDYLNHRQISVSIHIDKVFGECACGRKHKCRSVTHDQMVRLVVGFYLYLKTMPSGSLHPSSWSPLGKSTRFYVSAVTNGANICEVGHEIKLNAEELDILEGH